MGATYKKQNWNTRVGMVVKEMKSEDSNPSSHPEGLKSHSEDELHFCCFLPLCIIYQQSRTGQRHWT